MWGLVTARPHWLVAVQCSAVQSRLQVLQDQLRCGLSPTHILLKAAEGVFMGHPAAQDLAGVASTQWAEGVCMINIDSIHICELLPKHLLLSVAHVNVHQLGRREEGQLCLVGRN